MRTMTITRRKRAVLYAVDHWIAGWFPLWRYSFNQRQRFWLDIDQAVYGIMIWNVDSRGRLIRTPAGDIYL